MKSLRAVAGYRKLRREPVWELLAAHNGPVIAGVLKTLLSDGGRTLAASILHERVTVELESLRADGEDLPQTAQAYVSEWLRSGWLTRSLPRGASQEVFELTPAAADAIRFLDSSLAPRKAATESRLATVIAQLTRLAEETDPNPESRVRSLLQERDRIDREIEAVRSGARTVLPQDRALERTREAIELSLALTEDFRRVRDEFDKLNRGLRQSLMENEGSRGDVLEALFAGVDVIGQSEAGKTFAAFWNLLTDREQSGSLSEALDAVTSRPFARRLEPGERKFLLNLTARLLDEGSGVHDVLQNFARSLKTFVQSREFREQRRLHQLLKQAGQAALEAKETVRPNLPLGYELALTSSRVRSVAQWVLYDPSERAVDSAMVQAEDSELTLEALGELLKQSEIDFRTLRRNVRQLLRDHAQVSIGQLLQAFPAEQGLGSVVGYVALGTKHGEVTKQSELVEWTGLDETIRRARLPAIYFLRDKQHAFAE